MKSLGWQLFELEQAQRITAGEVDRRAAIYDYLDRLAAMSRTGEANVTVTLLCDVFLDFPEDEIRAGLEAWKKSNTKEASE